jgi:hypothetical protein
LQIFFDKDNQLVPVHNNHLEEGLKGAANLLDDLDAGFLESDDDS